MRGIKNRIRTFIRNPVVRMNLMIIYYLLQILFIVMYSTTTVQPFVYVHF